MSFDRKLFGSCSFRVCVVFCVLAFGCAHTAADPMEKGTGHPSRISGGGDETAKKEAAGLDRDPPRIEKGEDERLGLPAPAQIMLDEAWKQAREWEKVGKLKKAAALLVKTARGLEGRAVVELEAEAFRLYLKARWLERALLALQRYAAATEREYERVYAARRMRGLVKSLAGRKRLISLYRLTKADTLLRGALAPWVVEFYRGRGAERKANDYLKDTERERKLFVALASQGSVGIKNRIAVAVSFSGPYRRLAFPILRGVLLAADVYGRSGGRQSLDVVVVDVSDTKDAVGILETLKYGHRALAAVGPVDHEKASRLADAAEKVAFPVVTLTPDSKTASKSSHIFRYLPDNSLRAKVMAKAMSKRLKPGSRVGVIAPSNSAGKLMVQVFKEELSDSKLTVSAESHYSPGATHFAAQAREMKKARVKGVFVVAPARTLKLIAPQLALAGLWSGTTNSEGNGRSRSRRDKRRTILLAATADGVDSAMLKSTSRYIQGALLCPGFFPLVGDKRWGEFSRDFNRAYGSKPDIISAYAYEAAVTLRRVMEADEHSGDAAAISGKLAELSTSGRGKVFDDQGNISVAPGVFEVLGVTVRRVE